MRRNDHFILQKPSLHTQARKGSGREDPWATLPKVARGYRGGGIRLYTRQEGFAALLAKRPLGASVRVLL